MTVTMVSLRRLLLSSLVLPMAATAGLMSLVSYGINQREADQAALNLQIRTTVQVADHLRSYLRSPQQVIRTMAEAVAQGQINPADRVGATRFLWNLHETFPDAPYLNIGSANGDFIGVGQADNTDITHYLEVAPAASITRLEQFKLDERGHVGPLYRVKPFGDFRGDGWYHAPVLAGRPIWTPIYNWVDAPEVMAMGAGMPIVKGGRVIGVAGVDVFLANISRYLQRLQLTNSGEVFIVETDGLLVADSSGRLPFTIVAGKGERQLAINSPDPTIRDAARSLRQQLPSLAGLKQPAQLRVAPQGHALWVRAEPFRDREGLNWTIVVAIPDADVSGPIRQVAFANLLISLTALALAGALAWRTLHRLHRQLHGLTDAAEAIANGDLSQEVPQGPIQELANLAVSFNTMTQRLRRSFATLRSRNRDMRRTIQHLSEQLESCRQDLNVEQMFRRRSEERLRAHLQPPPGGEGTDPLAVTPPSSTPPA